MTCSFINPKRKCMKTIISTLIIALGFYSILLSTSILWKISVNEKEIATENVYLLDYLKQKHLKEKPDCNFNKEVCLKEYSSMNYEKKKHYSIVLIGGLVLLISGVILFFYSKKKILEFKTKREFFLFRLAEVTIHTLYWLMIGLLYFTIQMLVKKEVSGCVIDSMFIFYAAGLTGFYIAYFYLTDEFMKNKKMTKWFIGCFFTVLIGFILAYVVPFFSMLIHTPNSLSNPAFFIGFLYLSFFVVANVVVGTIFRGFFNWIKIIYSLQLETQNELQ